MQDTKLNIYECSWCTFIAFGQSAETVTASMRDHLGASPKCKDAFESGRPATQGWNWKLPAKRNIACAVVAIVFGAAGLVAQEAPKPVPCLAVVEAGSHAFRNIMLGGIAGALVSKKQYKVVAAVNYPAHVGQKFHGNDLQMFAASGTKVVILDKKFTDAEKEKACTP